MTIAASRRTRDAREPEGALNDTLDIEDGPDEPVIEKPDRINCLPYNLARGQALVCGRQQICMADLGVVINVTLDSAPSKRAQLFRALITAGGKLATSGVEAALSCSKPTALSLMETLSRLGVVDITKEEPTSGRPETEIRLAGNFAWFASDECRQLLW